MDKKKIATRSSITFLFLLLCFNLNAHTNMGYLLRFESKDQILEWSHKEFGYYPKDTVSYFIDGRECFILFGSFTSGPPSYDICIFINSPLENTKGERWRSICRRQVITREVNIELDQERREMLFKTHLGRVIMTLPFDALNLVIDRQ